jgi:transposase-like protein
MEQRRKFDKEFKLMTVELSKNREDLKELAKELDIRVELTCLPAGRSTAGVGSF